MSAFEELGAGLGSLSLGDMYGHHNVPQHVGQDDDDLMDIDSVESFDLPSISNNNDGLHNSHLQKHDGTCDEDEDELTDGNSLFLGILNPTSLGAKYALKPRKLLMPPPTPRITVEEFEPAESIPIHTSEHDYEFDTSLLTSVSKPQDTTVARQRNFGGFNAFNQNHAVEPMSPLASVSEPQAPFYNNMMSMAYQRKPDPVQIHHHHYYPPQGETNPFAGKSMLSKYQENFSSQSPKIMEQMEEVPLNWTSLTKRDHGQTLQNTQNTQNTQQMFSPNMGTSSEMLPSPWDPHAVPAERTPYVLSSYLQLLVNVVLSGYAVHIVIGMVQAIKQDVAHKLNQESNNLLVEIALCERSYHENHCSPETIVPALEKMCAYWEKCMNQDPSQIGNRSLVSAHIIGMILNSLIEPLSFKVLAVGAAAIMVIFACNFAFGYVRAKTYYGWTSATPRA